MEVQPPGFCGAKISISEIERPIGTMLIYNPRRSSLNTGSPLNKTFVATSWGDSHLFSKAENQTVSFNDSLTADSGEIIDEKDPLFRITYTYDGTKVPRQDFLFAMFDGLAQLTQ